MMAASISAEKKKYTMAGLPPGAVLSILALQSLILLILLLGWVIGQWAWLRHSFPGGLFAGSFPIVVTWAGAAGGIAHAVRGLTTHWSRYVDPRTSDEERETWNAWSIVQGPLGAVYGSAGILLLVVVLGVIGSGSSGDLDLSPAGRLTLSAIAFIIGYHQQIFHDMITRTVEAIFAPRSRSTRDETAYASDVASNGSQAWQGGAYVELAPDAGQQWTDGGYAEMPAGQGAQEWQEEAPAATDTETWAEAAPAQTWSPESDAAYAGVWTEPPATQPDEADHDSAGVDASDIGTNVIEEDQTIPIEPRPAKGPEVATASTARTDKQAPATDTTDLGLESTRVDVPDANGEAAPPSPVLTQAAESVPSEIDGAAIDTVATGDGEIDGAPIDAAEPPTPAPRTPAVGRTRSTTSSRTRRLGR
jgi:hypothetical protein